MLCISNYLVLIAPQKVTWPWQKIWNIWPVRCTHKTLRPLCTFRPHEYCLIGKEENKVTIKQASWFIPGTVVCILTRSWEKLCNRVKGLLKVVMKVFLGGGGGGGYEFDKTMLSFDSAKLLLFSYSYSMLNETEMEIAIRQVSHTCFK